MNFHIEIEPEPREKEIQKRARRQSERWTEFLFKNKWINTAFLLILLDLVIFVLMLMWMGISHIEGTNNRAQFGDMFGVVNALFSGLAFAGIIYTILLQRHELSLQRKELKDTREELKLTREAHQKNCSIMDQQLLIARKSAEIAQVKFDSEFLPDFAFKSGSMYQTYQDGTFEFKVNIHNNGNPVNDMIVLRMSKADDVDDYYTPYVNDYVGRNTEFQFRAKCSSQKVKEENYRIEYVSKDGRHWTTHMTVLFDLPNKIKAQFGSTEEIK